MSLVKMDSKTVRDKCLKTMEAIIKQRKLSDKKYVDNKMNSINWWRRLVFLKPLSFDDVEGSMKYAENYPSLYADEDFDIAGRLYLASHESDDIYVSADDLRVMK